MDRRKFLKTGSLAAAGLALNARAGILHSLPLAKSASSKMIGIQIGAPSFVDEGVEGALDSIQERACVNTLFAFVYSYKEGLSGRTTWTGLDHGRPQNGAAFHGGYYSKINPEYYKDTIFKGDPQVLRAPDEGDFDLLASVLPAAKERGIKTIAWLADQIHEEIPQFREMAEVDLFGHKLDRVCLNNPHFQSFLRAMVKDCVTSNDIDGLLWRSERWGALTNTLYKWDGVGKKVIGCFCPHCLEKGKKNGINTERAIEGYQVLAKYVGEARVSRNRPVEGYYAAFWRILLRYPEILAWEMFWYDSLRETYQLVYRLGKSIKPDLPVGCAIPHSISFNPFYRAVVDLQELSKYNDFMKIIFYNVDAGPRCCNYVDDVFGTYLNDLAREERLTFMYNTMGFSEGDYEKIKSRGFSADYVSKETKTWLEAAKGTNLKVYPGIDIDVSPENDKQPRSREGVRDAVLAALEAGAPGVVLARMYSEMKLDHLAGAGDAIRQLKMC